MAELKKVLSFKTVLLITINSIMGTGIFFLPAVGAKYAGPASLISWAILSVLSIYIAMCFAELVSMFPTSGGIYEFCKQAFGRFPSFIIGWMTLVTANITLAMLIIGALQYLLPYEGLAARNLIIVISIFFILLFNYVAYRGMQTSATMLVAFAFITLGTLISLMVPGFLNFDLQAMDPFFIAPGFMVFLAVFFIAETFFGWESSTFLAGETKDGEKVMPKALILGTIFISVFSFLFVLSALASVGWEPFGNARSPLLYLADIFYGGWGVKVFTLLVYLSIIGSVAGWVVSAPRLILSMAEDKLFISQFAKIHKKHGTPHRAIILQTLFSILFVLIGVGSYLTLLHLLVPLLILLYCCVMLAVVFLRYKMPEKKRYYKVPFGKSGPLVIIFLFLLLIGAWLFLTDHALEVLAMGASFFFIGIPIYFLLEMYYDPKAIRFADNILAYITLFTERFALPKKIRKEILHLIGNIKGKTILEFGSSVGTLTTHLAEEVGKEGKIIATDHAEKELSILKKRAEKKGHDHVKVIHDPSHASRIHPTIPKVHIVVSVGSLGYLQAKEKVLREMNKRLKVGSKICFVDYDKFFDIIPNVPWLGSDKTIKRVFKEAGFTVNVVRKQGFAWKYIFIYGIKEKEIK